MKLRLSCLCFGLLALAACGKSDDHAPFVESRLPFGVAARFFPPEGWAWGLVKVGDRPALRYGVSSPPVVPRGDVVLLAGHGESAELWFETARDLNAAGWTVWILEGAGEGGSGRFAGARDLAFVPDFSSDIDGLRAFLRAVVRPPADRPAILVASGTAALTVLAAVERGAPAGGLVLLGPVEPLVERGLGPKTARAKGQLGWTRTPPETRRTVRERAYARWAIANPDLRMGGLSNGWVAARAELRKAALAPEALARVRVPTTVIARSASPIPCAAMPACRELRIAADASYPLAEDGQRQAWVKALIASLGGNAP